MCQECEKLERDLMRARCEMNEYLNWWHDQCERTKTLRQEVNILQDDLIKKYKIIRELLAERD